MTRGLEGHRPKGSAMGWGSEAGTVRTLFHCIVQFSKISVELWLIP